MRLFRTFALLGVLGVLAACQPSGPLRTFTQGDQIAFYDFAQSGSFEEGGYETASLRIENNIYRIDVRQGNGELWWGQWGDTLSDVTVQADIAQITDRNENAYGLMCRVRGSVGQSVSIDGLDPVEPVSETDADATPEATPETEATASVTEEAAAPTALPSAPQGDGYLFLIQGSGSYGIFLARSRSLTPLVNWTASDAINVGPGRNVLRAVCVGDYLAFYINDRLVAEAIDSTYPEGQVGMVASAASRTGVTVDFDNLTVNAATLGS